MSVKSARCVSHATQLAKLELNNGVQIALLAHDAGLA